MKKLILITLQIVLCWPGFITAQQEWQFVNQFGSNWMDNVNNNDEEIYDMTVDDSGNLYITGRVYGNNRIDGDTFSHPSGTLSHFFAKFDCTGQLEWYHELETSNSFAARVIHFKDPQTDSSFIFIISGRRIMKYTPNGDSTTFFKSTTTLNAYNGFFDFDQYGNMYSLVLRLQGGEYAPGYDFSSNNTFYLAKHDKQGNILMFQPLIESTIHTLGGQVSLRVNNDGNVFIGGTTPPIGEFHVIGGDTIDSNKGGGNTQAFLIKLDSLGNFIWSKQSEGGGGLGDLTLTQNDDLLFVLWMWPGATFDGDDLNRRAGLEDFNKVVVMDEDGEVKHFDQ